MRDFPPTNERRSQGLLTHLRTVTTRALGGSTAKKYAPHTPPETHPVQNSPRAAGPGAHPVQNSPCSAGPSAQPVQNSPNTPKKAHFSQFCPSRENFVPHPPPRPPAGRTLYRAQRQTRYKTLPAQPVRRPNRYKTLPTHPKKPISVRFARAGRTLYRFHPHAPQQGELCTAPRAKPGTKLPLLSRSVDPAGTKLSQHAHTSSPPGTKLSQHAHTSSPTGTKFSQHAQNCPFQPVLAEQGELCTAPAAQPVQNSPNTPTPAAQPVQNSPNTPKKAHFSPFWRSRENFVPHQQPNRYKTLPAHPFYSGSAKKFAQHTPHHNRTAKKFAQHT